MREKSEVEIILRDLEEKESLTVEQVALLEMELKKVNEDISSVEQILQANEVPAAKQAQEEFQSLNSKIVKTESRV